MSNDRSGKSVQPMESPVRIRGQGLARRLLCAAMALIFMSGSALAMDREQLRENWQALIMSRSEVSPWAQLPDIASFSPGGLTDAAQADALNMVNFARELAGLPAVGLDELYTLRAQLGALVLAANDELSHAPERPAGMPDELYDIGLTGTANGNIASFNWFSPDILASAVTGFIREDGEFNLSELSHRRWLLDPQLRHTGFGLASAASGNSYAVMYVVDDTDTDADFDWDLVAWPCAQAFPVELMRADLAWSISLNPARYDVAASSPGVTLTEEVSGEVFHFELRKNSGDGYCRLSTEHCGTGDCLIFRPDMTGRAIDEYLQNQHWTVEVTGLFTADGEARGISFQCDMVSLYPQSVANVELSPREATLKPGGSLQLSAEAIPGWADDVSISWQSSDDAIASVSEDGVVTAHASGACEISAISVNGHSDVCTLRVE